MSLTIFPEKALFVPTQSGKARKILLPGQTLATQGRALDTALCHIINCKTISCRNEFKLARRGVLYYTHL